MRTTPIQTFLVAAALALAAAPASAETARLRAPVETSGPAVTLGDFFVDAGPAGSRAVGPAPVAGRTALFSARFVQAAAAAAGLDWAPPPGMTTIAVTRTSAAASGMQSAATYRSEHANSGAVVHRNDVILIVYAFQGVKLSMRGRALNDAGIGEPVRVTNLSSNRTVDAVVTGEGAATIPVQRN